MASQHTDEKEEERTFVVMPGVTTSSGDMVIRYMRESTYLDLDALSKKHLSEIRHAFDGEMNVCCKYNKDLSIINDNTNIFNSEVTTEDYFILPMPITYPLTNNALILLEIPRICSIAELGKRCI